jgi:hypothetical protein
MHVIVVITITFLIIIIIIRIVFIQCILSRFIYPALYIHAYEQDNRYDWKYECFNP